MELAYPDIDPHVASARIEKGVAREAKTGDVVMRRQVLVADANVHVTEIENVTKILRGAVVLFVGHGAIPLQRGILSLSGTGSQRLQLLSRLSREPAAQPSSPHERSDMRAVPDVADAHTGYESRRGSRADCG